MWQKHVIVTGDAFAVCTYAVLSLHGLNDSLMSSLSARCQHSDLFELSRTN
jgi:hypothetical protein